MASQWPIGNERVAAVAVVNGDGGGPFVIVRDHASNRIPPEYRSLRLSRDEQQALIAWDPGALDLSLPPTPLLDAPLVYSTVSRLVVDGDRARDAPT